MLQVAQLGRARYGPVWQWQRRCLQRRQRGEIPDQLILVEHEPVITLGRNAALDNVLVDEATLAAYGIELHHIERGGDVTFHGPGQLVGYPIVHLRERGIAGPVRYVWMLEEVLIEALAEYGVEAFRREKMRGVWTDRGKIAALGVHVSRGVTMHGFALNVNTNLDYYQLIVPCGLTDRRVTSLSQWCGREIPLREVEERVIAAFVRLFGYESVQRNFDCQTIERGI
ncbi:MAG: lipoyl(octanoyl) transferase LipB [Acidobacteriota bacterium]|nr:lipoyl(octanoyl) transferase LipB [Blastocatellia bacterium]MDW8238822.1 lipoyl(octanoyl) transferase LipB [Acidobacteriota bacterium]